MGRGEAPLVLSLPPAASATAEGRPHTTEAKPQQRSHRTLRPQEEPHRTEATQLTICNCAKTSDARFGKNTDERGELALGRG